MAIRMNDHILYGFDGLSMMLRKQISDSFAGPQNFAPLVVSRELVKSDLGFLGYLSADKLSLGDLPLGPLLYSCLRYLRAFFGKFYLRFSALIGVLSIFDRVSHGPWPALEFF
jgi:hypothetical protein